MPWQLLLSQRCSDKSTHLLFAEDIDAHICHTSQISGMACTVNFEQNYPFPQMFLVDGGGGGRQQDSAQPPSLIPCWSFPPAQERMKSRGKSKGCMGISPGLALVVLFLFLLVFAALGFEAFKISRIEDQLRNSDGEVRTNMENS